jgi:hypothetical protein
VFIPFYLLQTWLYGFSLIDYAAKGPDSLMLCDHHTQLAGVIPNTNLSIGWSANVAGQTGIHQPSALTVPRQNTGLQHLLMGNHWHNKRRESTYDHSCNSTEIKDTIDNLRHRPSARTSRRHHNWYLPRLATGFIVVLGLFRASSPTTLVSRFRF